MSDTIQLIVPVLYSRDNSRPAHFNWEVESANGSAARIGQYACGSYWVAPASGDTGVKLISLLGNQTYTGGETDWIALDVDPVPNAHGLLPYGPDIWDAAGNPPTARSSGGEPGQIYGSNSAAQNVIGTLPLTFSPSAGTPISLVACMQRNEPETSVGGTKAIIGAVVDAYCVLTVVAAPPPDNGANSIRPNIVGDTKYELTWDDFDLTQLPSIASQSASDSTELENMRLKWTHSIEVFAQYVWNGSAYKKWSEGGRAFRAHLLHEDYGSYWASNWLGSLKRMFSPGNTLTEKKPVLAAMLAHAFDLMMHLYGTATYYGAWTAGAGQSSGQSTPHFFIGCLLNTSTSSHASLFLQWQRRLQRVSGEANWKTTWEEQGPSEMRQIKRGQTGVVLWGDNHKRRPVATTGFPYYLKEYWSDLLARKNYDTCTLTPNMGGQRTECDQHGYIDGPPNAPGSFYHNVTIDNFRETSALCLLWPKFRELWNNDETIEYTDRCWRHGLWSDPDPLAMPTGTDQDPSICSPVYAPGGCNNMQTLWGPDPADVLYAIEDGTGRYKSRHGLPFDDVSFSFCGLTWSEIALNYDGPTYEDYAVPVGTCAPPDVYVFPKLDGSGYEAYIRSGTQPSATRTRQIFYTTDGSEPTGSSSVFDDTTLDVASASTEIKAFTRMTGFEDSPIVTVSFSGGRAVAGGAGGGGSPAEPAEVKRSGLANRGKSPSRIGGSGKSLSLA